jgi:hypothetical protein
MFFSTIRIFCDTNSSFATVRADLINRGIGAGLHPRCGSGFLDVYSLRRQGAHVTDFDR